jgi:hypothetical protein
VERSSPSSPAPPKQVMTNSAAKRLLDHTKLTVLSMLIGACGQQHQSLGREKLFEMTPPQCKRHMFNKAFEALRGSGDIIEAQPRQEKVKHKSPRRKSEQKYRTVPQFRPADRHVDRPVLVPDTLASAVEAPHTPASAVEAPASGSSSILRREDGQRSGSKTVQWGTEEVRIFDSLQGSWLKHFKVRHYGVLQGIDDTSIVQSISRRDVVIVDPAGLDFIQGARRPSDARGASQEIYKWIRRTTRKAFEFDSDVKKHVTTPTDARYARYARGLHVIHVVGPNFRAHQYTKNEAIQALVNTYSQVFAEYHLRVISMRTGILN